MVPFRCQSGLDAASAITLLALAERVFYAPIKPLPRLFQFAGAKALLPPCVIPTSRNP